MKKNTYILRYYLPCEPICDVTVTKRRSDSLVAYCLENQIEAVMLYVDLNPYWYYAPDSLEHTKYLVEAIRDTVEKLRKNNISYQLNYQNLIGAWDGGADLSAVNGWETFVDQYGLQSYSSACCIGEKFRKIAGEKLTLWAQTKPDAIWIDDDIRFHNHGAITRQAWQGNPLSTDFGCFCEHHVALFNQKYHLSCTRETLVNGIQDGSLREQWLAFSKEAADEFMAWIEKTVHSVSPETRIAVMTSLPDIHSVEGRDWGSFLSKLSGKFTPIMRPTFGPYEEKGPREFVDSYLFLEQLKTNIKSQYDQDFILCPEIENTRFTRWSKTVSATGFQLMLSGFLGCRGITLSLFDLEGCILEEEPEFAELLTQRRAVVDSLAQENLWQMQSGGIGLITAPDRVKHAFSGRKVDTMVQLAGKRIWDRLLIEAGIPCQYVTPEHAADCNGVALDAYTASLLTDEEVMAVLAGGVVLNSGAAMELSARGFGEYLGITVGEVSHCIAATEVFHTLQRSDGSEVRLPIRTPGYHWYQLQLNGAEQLTTFMTPYGIGFPGVTRYQNALGGVVYTFAQNGNFGDGFYSNYRMRFLKSLCRDISSDTLITADNNCYALTAVKKDENNTFVFFANLAADTVNEVSFCVPEEAVLGAEWIDMDGKSHAAKVDGKNIICRNTALNLYGCLVCKIIK